MRKTDIAWAAGFFDGEGHIALPSRSPSLIVTQKDREPLDHFQKIFGGIGTISFRSNAHRYAVHGEKAMFVLVSMLPYLKAKRELAQEAIVRRLNPGTEAPTFLKHWKGEKKRLLKILELRQRNLSFATIGGIMTMSRQRVHQLYQIALILANTSKS